MFNCIKEYCRKKYTRNFNIRKDIAFINLKDISSVGFLYKIGCKEDIVELLEIHNFLKKRGIRFRGLAVEGAKNVFDRVAESKGEENGGKRGKPIAVIPQELADKAELTVIPYEKLSWIGVVEESLVKVFFAEKADLFISFNKDDNFTLNHLFATYVDSPMRVGMVHDSQVNYSIVIEGKERSLLPVTVYLNQIFYYLEIIQTA